MTSVGRTSGESPGIDETRTPNDVCSAEKSSISSIKSVVTTATMIIDITHFLVLGLTLVSMMKQCDRTVVCKASGEYLNGFSG